MADRQIYASFPGVLNVRSATYTLTHGISPGIGTLECYPQNAPISESGDLVFYAGQDTITIADCKIGLYTPLYDGNQAIVSLQILDRRWKWAFGEIYGEYNQRDSKNLVVDDTAKEAYELMNRCLIAMGETNYDTSAVRPGLLPHVEWVGTNPAKALADLCDQFGYTVVLKLDQSVVIETIGDGADLPKGGELTISQTVDPPERPDSIKVIGAPTRFQCLLHLEAVGRDLDGTVVPIDQLSYAPPPDANGNRWTGADGEFSSITDELTRRLARSTVFRWYRVKISATDDNFKVELPTMGSDSEHPNQLNSFVRVGSLREILPLSGDLVETYAELGRERRKKARVYGTFFVGNSGHPRNSNQKRGPLSSPGVYTPPFVTVEGSPVAFQYQEQLASFPGVPSDFSIIEEFGIVEFPQPVHKVVTVGSGTYLVAADLYLMCSFNWRNVPPEGSGNVQTPVYAYYRYAYSVGADGPKYGTKPEIVNKEAELQAQIFATYSPGSPGLFPTWNYLRPLTDLNEAAQHYVDGAAQKYITTGAADSTYMGLKTIDTDGAIKQVTWSVGPEGPTTRASRNSEPHPLVRPYKFVRFLEMLSQLARDPRALLPDLPRPFIPPVT